MSDAYKLLMDDDEDEDADQDDEQELSHVLRNYTVVCTDGSRPLNPYWSDGKTWYLTRRGGARGDWVCYLKVDRDNVKASETRWTVGSVLERVMGWGKKDYTVRVCLHRPGDADCPYLGPGTYIVWVVLMHAAPKRPTEAVEDATDACETVEPVKGRPGMAEPWA